MTVSFGIEFEFDLINNNNRRTVRSGSTPLYLARNWSYQRDPTATVELRSPVFTSLEQYINECNKQFWGWINEFDSLIPYMHNSSSRSLGQHMHVGKPRVRLTLETREKLAKEIIKIYPLLMAIQSSPIPSRRGLTSVYCRSMTYYNNICDYDHYAEISLSHNGTLELRVFDANIPQSSLVNAFIVTRVAKKVWSRNFRGQDTHVSLGEYGDEREKALRNGLIGVNVTQKLKQIRNIIGNIEIPEIPAIKESLYLMARYRLNFYGVMKYTHVNHYEYFKKVLTDSSKYLEHLIEIPNIMHKEKLKQWKEKAREIETLDQLIGISIAVDKTLSRTLIEAIEERISEQPQTRRNITITRRINLGRSQVRELINNERYTISRINNVEGLTQEQVAERIHELLRLHGNGFVNVLSPEEIINTAVRFYVFWVREPNTNRTEICGCVGVHVRDRTIQSLVIDRRFRRLGIARRLVSHVLNVLVREGASKAKCWIRKQNNASLNLFKRFGFKIIDHIDRSYLLELNWRDN